MKLIKARTRKVFLKCLLCHNGWVSTVDDGKKILFLLKPEFFPGLIHYYLSCVYYCDDQSCLHICLCFIYRNSDELLIDHSVLVQKLSTYDIPSQVKGWIVDFLMERKQRVKLAQDCHSEWRSVPSGVPQRTKRGPWLFLVI